ncbi:MAG TPA: condensation domain-containing protein [Puia sp.]|nr:condensation domain-containing protein [Puia sp.]
MRELLKRLREDNITVSLDSNDLKIKFNGDRLPQEVIQDLKDNKAQIVEYLKSQEHHPAQHGIPPAKQDKCYPLSPAQFRLWVLSQYEWGNIAYNMPGIYTFEGELSYASLEYSFATLIERHEILRTVFREDDQKEIKQFIDPVETAGFRMTYNDLRQEQDKAGTLKKLIGEYSVKPFDLASGPLLRAGIFQVEDKKWIFVFVIHHIIGDGWSMNILMRELTLFYSSHVRGETPSLPPLRIQYKDYAVWQQQQLKEGVLKPQRSYWLKKFEGDLPVLDLPVDKIRPAYKTYNGGSIQRVINSAAGKGLKGLIRQHNCTLFMGLLAAVSALLHRYSNQSDLIIGTPIVGREHVDLDDQVGHYLNTLALRIPVNGKDSYRELLKNIRRVTLEAYDHQFYPFDELVEELHLQRDMSRNPLFDVLVILQNTKINDNKMEQKGKEPLTIKGYADRESLNSKFDLTFDFVEVNGNIHMNIVYAKDIFNTTTVERMANHLEHLLRAIVEDPELPVQQLEYLSPEEKRRSLVEFEEKTTDFKPGKSIMELFEEQAAISPGKAVINESSRRFGAWLEDRCQVRADDIVGIRLSRQEWMLPAMLGVLRAGAAYLLFDTLHSQRQMEYIISDSNCKVVVGDEEYENFLNEHQRYSSSTLKFAGKPGSLAFIVYPVGLSRQPKGLMVNNNSILNYLAWNIIDCFGRIDYSLNNLQEVLSLSSVEGFYKKMVEYTKNSILSDVNIKTTFNSPVSDEF